jgi:hypothetical protein
MMLECIQKHVHENFQDVIPGNRGMRWRNWLRHCATSRKVAGLIPDGVI